MDQKKSLNTFHDWFYLNFLVQNHQTIYVLLLFVEKIHFSTLC